jgi:hypothetical protein
MTFTQNPVVMAVIYGKPEAAAARRRLDWQQAGSKVFSARPAGTEGVVTPR